MKQWLSREKNPVSSKIKDVNDIFGYEIDFFDHVELFYNISVLISVSQRWETLNYVNQYQHYLELSNKSDKLPFFHNFYSSRKKSSTGSIQISDK